MEWMAAGDVAERWFRGLLESAPDAMVIVDDAGRRLVATLLGDWACAHLTDESGRGLSLLEILATSWGRAPPKKARTSGSPLPGDGQGISSPRGVLPKRLSRSYSGRRKP